MIPEREVGGGVFGGSLLSVVVLFVCIPTGREDERAVSFFLRLRLFNYPGAGGRRAGLLVALRIRWRRFWYSCQRVERASSSYVFTFKLLTFGFPGAGSGDKVLWLSIFGLRAFDMHAKGERMAVVLNYPTAFAFV